VWPLNVCIHDPRQSSYDSAVSEQGTMTSKVVLVCGGTGLQGGGLLKDLVGVPGYHVKTITRKASAKAWTLSGPTSHACRFT
jgi:hypothetical protein